MADPPQDAGELLRALGWRQGSVVAKESLVELGLKSHSLAILLSQDCDVVKSVVEEPTVELILGEKREAPRPDCMFSRNPREIDLPLSKEGGAVSLCARNRVWVPKEKLSSYHPASTEILAPPEVTLLASWIAKRYTRAAWPDAFNVRLRPIEKKLDRLCKSQESRRISAILMMLVPPKEELPEGSSYQLAIWLTTSEESRMDQQASQDAEVFGQKLSALLQSCKGIVLSEWEVKSEADVSMADLRAFRRFDRDYRSIAPSPGGQMAPAES